jgi:hypothetical protein
VFVNTDPDLRLPDGIAQTIKHHTRTKKSGDPITAKISKISATAHGVRVQIDWSSQARSGSEDALDLAQRCVAAWRRFFKQHKLDSG